MIERETIEDPRQRHGNGTMIFWGRDMEVEYEMAAAAFAPAPLPEAPTDGPNDIWFFRLDPRPAA